MNKSAFEHKQPSPFVKWAWYHKLCLQHSSHFGYLEAKDENDVPAPQKESTSSDAVTWGYGSVVCKPGHWSAWEPKHKKAFTSSEAKIQQL